jgi:hypothetical protein
MAIPFRSDGAVTEPLPSLKKGGGWAVAEDTFWLFGFLAPKALK